MQVRAIGPESGEEARFALILLLALSFVMSLTGCRRDPAQPTVMYERERAELPPPAVKEVYLPDRQPWEGKTRTIDHVPAGILLSQKKIEREMGWIDTIIYGFRRTPPPPPPPPLPDRCPPPGVDCCCSSIFRGAECCVAKPCIHWPLRR